MPCTLPSSCAYLKMSNSLRTDLSTGLATFSPTLHAVNFFLPRPARRRTRGCYILCRDGRASPGSDGDDDDDDDDDAFLDMLSSLYAWVILATLVGYLLHVTFQNLSGTPRATLCAGPT